MSESTYDILWPEDSRSPETLLLQAESRISALEAAMAKADELEMAVEFWTIAEEPDVSDAIYRLKRTLTAYRQARDATR